MNTILGYLGQENKIPTMLALFEQMKMEVEPNIGTYHILLKCCGFYKQIDEMMKIRDELNNKNYEPDITTHQIILESLASAGKSNEIQEYKEKLKKEGPLDIELEHAIIA